VRVWYLALEPYRERYTELLTGWFTAACARRRVEVVVVNGDSLTGNESIRTGQVLDAHGRCHWATTQVARLVSRLHEVRPDDWVLVEDLFTPGYEALPYIFDQTGDGPWIAVRNWAQSVDPDDFTYRMRRWMRPFERLVDQTSDLVFVASTCHKEMLQSAGLDDGALVKVVGLPFDSAQVRSLGPRVVLPWHERDDVVVYSSRLDREKQPHFFMDVVDAMHGEARFVVCTGAAGPRSNDPSAVERLLALKKLGRLDLRSGLTKRSYYEVLAGARVQVNTARQDFVSFTALEASAFGVPTLAPAFRSFPEALKERRSQLYVPWSLEDCCERLRALLRAGEPACRSLSEEHDRTFDRMLDAMASVSGTAIG
jgi:glycosyltransferase involved in cell wall biosynthesis